MYCICYRSVSDGARLSPGRQSFFSDLNLPRLILQGQQQTEGGEDDAAQVHRRDGDVQSIQVIQ